MFVILTYDINAKRVGKALKICRRYLHHVQRSVFEGQLTMAKLERLSKELEKVIEPGQDAICIYIMESTRFTNRLEIGRTADRSNIL